jgi:hypothetical protein
MAQWLVEDIERVLMTLELAVRIARWLPWAQALALVLGAGSAGWFAGRRSASVRALSVRSSH